jgi:hypothetical protein
MKLITAVVCILTTMSLTAQSKLSVFKSSNSVKPDIEKIVHDYFENFNNIKGDTIGQSISTIEFNSKVLPKGADAASITQYKTSGSYSWQCNMFSSEEFKEAVQRYRQYYRELNGVSFTFSNKTTYRLTGNYDAPDESRSFASTILETHSYDRIIKNFKIELGLNYSFPEWSVRIMVYEKVGDEDIRPSSGYFR